jgi:mono/diheme cytochrome c family protein
MLKIRRSFVAVAVLVAACVPFLVFAAQGRAAQVRPPSQSPDLPPGAMQARAHTACMECHDSRIITQQRLSKDAWGKEVDKMVRWGTVLDPKDRDALVDYLSSNFPPEKPAEQAEKTAKRK